MIRKFTKTIQEVFEMSIEKEMGQERNELENMAGGEAIKDSLADELNQEASKNTPFLKSVNASKKEFD